MIIPLYNHEKYISDAIKSVIDQTIHADEIIVIDDGSSDGSADIVRSLATKHSVIRFSSRPNRGAHETINEGINAASGDFIAILNSDDVYHPRRLEICLCELRKSKTAKAVFTGVRILDSSGSPTNAPWYEAAIARYRNGTKLWLALLWANFFMTTSNVFVKREIFAEKGNFTSLRYCHDLDFFLRLTLSTGTTTFLDEKLLDYRVHAGNTISENYRKMRIELAAIMAAVAHNKYRAELLQFNVFAEFVRLAEHHSVSSAFVAYLEEAHRFGESVNGCQLMRDSQLNQRVNDMILRQDAEARGFQEIYSRMLNPLGELVKIYGKLGVNGALLSEYNSPIDTNLVRDAVRHMEEKLDFDPPKKKARARKHETKSGKPVGRPKVNDRKRRAILAARSRGLGINKIASELGVSRSTVRRVIAES